MSQPGSTRWGWLLLLTVLVSAGTLRAKGRPEAIQMGKSLFYPSIEVLARTDDNVFQDTINPVSAYIVEIGPDLVWRLPLSRSHVELAYRPRYRTYENNVIPSNWNHLFEGEMSLLFSNDVLLKIRDTFINGILEFREFTGGEPTFNGDKFTRNEFETLFSFPAGVRQQMEFGLFHEVVVFDEPEVSNFFDYMSRGVTGAWSRNLTEGLALRVGGRLADGEQERDDFVTWDLTTGDPVVLPNFNEQNITEWSLQVGVQGNVGQWFETRTFAGYAQMRFKDSLGQDYRGPVVISDSIFRFGQAWELRARLGRRPFQSAFNVANFFVADSAGLALSWSTPQRLKITFGGLKQKNRYEDPVVLDVDFDANTGCLSTFPPTGCQEGNDIPANPAIGFVPGVLRTDDLQRVDFELEFRFMPGRLSAFVGAFSEDRTSNVAFANYDRSGVNLGLRFGWLP